MGTSKKEKIGWRKDQRSQHASNVDERETHNRKLEFERKLNESDYNSQEMRISRFFSQLKKSNRPKEDKKK